MSGDASKVVNVDPPVITRPERLPLGDANFSWEQFEAFCREFISEINDGAPCHHYGKRGNSQRGIDLVCELKSGAKHVYQCRQWKSYSKIQAELTIEKTTYKADRYFVLLSIEASSDVRDVFGANSDWEIYDVRDISLKVRKLSPRVARRLIEQHFGSFWIKGFLGRSSTSSLLSRDEKFGSQLLNRANLFHHDWTFIGRHKELAALSSFVEDSRTTICLVPGAGTMGKTKLLYEFCKQIEVNHPYVAFVSEAIQPDDFTDSQYDPLLLIVDDAHARNDLNNLLSLVRRRKSWTKLIIATRPGAVAKIRASLSNAAFDAAEIVEFPRLKKLSFDDACELALQSLDSKLSSLAESLASQTRDSPLVTLIAGRLLSDKKVSPQQLERDADFQQTVLTRFTDTIVGEGLYEWQKRLIKLIAAMAPVAIDDERFVEHCAVHLKVERSNIALTIADFIEHGVVSKRGRLIEIVPHAVSEHILKNACVRNGVATGFVDEVIAAFGYRQTLLKNLAELDWKLSETKHAQFPKLLKNLWTQLVDDMRNGDNCDRCTLLPKLTEVALYQPDKVLDIIKWLINNPREVVDQGFQGIVSFTHEDVLNKLPPLLKYIAYDLGYLEEACNLLWQLGRDKTFRQSDDHGCYVLRELSQYRPDVPIQHYLVIIKTIRKWFETNEALGHVNNPIPMLENLLKKEETHVFERGVQAVFERFKIDWSSTAEIRRDAILVLENIALLSTDEAAIEAVQELGRTLTVQIGSYDSETEDSRYAEWQIEHFQALEALERIMLNSSSRLIAIEACHTIKTYMPYIGHKETLQKGREILGRAANDLRTRLSSAVIYGVLEGVSTNWRKERREALEKFRALACDVVKALTPAMTVDWICETLDECAAMKHDAHVQNFLSILAEIDSEFSSSLSQIVLERDVCSLKWYLPALLGNMRKRDQKKSDLVLTSLMERSPENKRVISYSFASSDWLENPSAIELTIFRALCRDKDSDIKRWSASGIKRLAANGNPLVKEIILNDFLDSSDTSLPAQIIGVFDGKHGYDPKNLSNGEITELLQHLKDIPKIDGHGISGFLEVASLRQPQDVVELLIWRVENDGNSDHEREPLPYFGFKQPLHGLHQCADGEGLCRQVTESARKFESLRYHAILFREISADFGPIGQKVLEELAATGSHKDFMIVLELLKAAPEKLLFDDHAFIDSLLKSATNLPGECKKALKSTAYTIATSGVKERTPGQPAKSDEILLHRSRAICDLYPKDGAMHEIYSFLADVASGRIADDEERDEERGFS